MHLVITEPCWLKSVTCGQDVRVASHLKRATSSSCCTRCQRPTHYPKEHSYPIAAISYWGDVLSGRHRWPSLRSAVHAQRTPRPLRSSLRLPRGGRVHPAAHGRLLHLSPHVSSSEKPPLSSFGFEKKIVERECGRGKDIDANWRSCGRGGCFQ